MLENKTALQENQNYYIFVHYLNKKQNIHD